jgi:DNA mismatch endonuclease (patch repair protein)
MDVSGTVAQIAAISQKKNSSFWQMKIELTRSRDIKSSNRLREMGYSVLRFWEHELRGQLSDCISTLETKITAQNVF